MQRVERGEMIEDLYTAEKKRERKKGGVECERVKREEFLKVRHPKEEARGSQSRSRESWLDLQTAAATTERWGKKSRARMR